MNTVPNRSRRLRLPAGAVVAAATLALVAGCGGGSDDDQLATAPSSATTPTVTTDVATTPVATTARATSTTPVATSAKKARATTPGEPAQDVPAPPAAQANEDALPAPSEADELVVKSPSGVDPKWRVAAQRQGKAGFCVVVTSLGVSNPAPDCQSGTLLALTYFSGQSDGQASATVAQIRRSVRNPPADILISGTATADVQRVVIDYRHRKYTAKLSPSEVSVPVDRKMAATLTGERASKLGSLPNPLKLRIFGISIPEDNGNPPTSAVSKTKTPRGGVMTLELQ